MVTSKKQMVSQQYTMNLFSQSKTYGTQKSYEWRTQKKYNLSTLRVHSYHRYSMKKGEFYETFKSTCFTGYLW